MGETVLLNSGSIWTKFKENPQMSFTSHLLISYVIPRNMYPGM